MNVCEACGNRGADFHVTDVRSGRAETRRVCAACAWSAGWQSSVSSPSCPDGAAAPDWLNSLSDALRNTGMLERALGHANPHRRFPHGLP